jgi:hypothetical protein
LSSILCRDFLPDDQCWNRNCDYLPLCLTFLHLIIWGFCCWPVLRVPYDLLSAIGRRSLDFFQATWLHTYTTIMPILPIF